MRSYKFLPFFALYKIKENYYILKRIYESKKSKTNFKTE